MSNTSVFGLYSTRQQVEDGIEQLRLAGFRAEDISVLAPENVGTKQLSHEKSTKAPEGAAAGGATGGVIGGALGWLVGVGALAIPGLGPFIAAGPLMGMLGGLGVGATVGGVAGALVGLGIPEYEAKRYEGLLKSGRILVSVHTDDHEWSSRARHVLEMTGADAIASASEAKGDYANAEKPRSLAGSGL